MVVKKHVSTILFLSINTFMHNQTICCDQSQILKKIFTIVFGVLLGCFISQTSDQCTNVDNDRQSHRIYVIFYEYSIKNAHINNRFMCSI